MDSLEYERVTRLLFEADARGVVVDVDDDGGEVVLHLPGREGPAQVLSSVGEALSLLEPVAPLSGKF